MTTYHIGTSKRDKTLVIETARNVDFLSCELYDYWGEREVTKKHLHLTRYAFLDMLKKQNPSVYSELRYAMVE